MVFFLKLMFRYLFLYPFSSCQASLHLSRCCYIIPKTFISPFESLCSANDSPICGRIHCFFFLKKINTSFSGIVARKITHIEYVLSSLFRYAAIPPHNYMISEEIVAVSKCFTIIHNPWGISHDHGSQEIFLTLS